MNGIRAESPRERSADLSWGLSCCHGSRTRFARTLTVTKGDFSDVHAAGKIFYCLGFQKRAKPFFDYAKEPIGSQGSNSMAGVSRIFSCSGVRYFLFTTTWYIYSSNQASDMT